MTKSNCTTTSRKLENHAAAVALNYFAYKLHQDSPYTAYHPAMAAGVTDRFWDVADSVPLWEANERRAERVAA